MEDKKTGVDIGEYINWFLTIVLIILFLFMIKARFLDTAKCADFCSDYAEQQIMLYCGEKFGRPVIQWNVSLNGSCKNELGEAVLCSEG